MKKVLAGKVFGEIALADLVAKRSAKPKHESSHVGADQEPLLSGWEAMDGRVRLILTREGHVIAASNGAGTLFPHDGCQLRGTALNLNCKEATYEQLQRILSVAVGAVSTIVLHKRSGEGHYVISSTGISANAVAVAVREASEGFVPVLADLEEAFGLTRSEVSVVEKLLSGHVPQTIADELEISVHTVRAHLRHCYDKLQVCSREELWHRLAPYRLN
jgi:DNA-binding CsgD family transcriptional regulator